MQDNKNLYDLTIMSSLKEAGVATDSNILNIAAPLEKVKESYARNISFGLFISILNGRDVGNESSHIIGIMCLSIN